MITKKMLEHAALQHLLCACVPMCRCVHVHVCVCVPLCFVSTKNWILIKILLSTQTKAVLFPYILILNSFEYVV